VTATRFLAYVVRIVNPHMIPPVSKEGKDHHQSLPPMRAESHLWREQVIRGTDLRRNYLSTSIDIEL
jgi:hypothetical protein